MVHARASLAQLVASSSSPSSCGRRLLLAFLLYRGGRAYRYPSFGDGPLRAPAAAGAATPCSWWPRAGRWTPRELECFAGAEGLSSHGLSYATGLASRGLSYAAGLNVAGSPPPQLAADVAGSVASSSSSLFFFFPHFPHHSLPEAELWLDMVLRSKTMLDLKPSQLAAVVEV